MLRPKQVNNGTSGAGRISSVLVVGWLVFAWSRPAFPDEQQHLQLAPIEFSTRVGGDIGYSYLSNTVGSTTSTMQLFGVQVNTNARARSYFWQPWFAQISGELGVDVGTTTSRYGAPPSTSTSGNMLISGQSTLDLLKYSRFPFQAHVFKNKSQVSGPSSGINSDFKSSGYDLNQQYHSLHGALDGLGFFTHNTNGRANFGAEEVRDQLGFEVTLIPFKAQTIRASGGITKLDHPLTGDHLVLDTLVANHVYQPGSVLSIASLVNLIKTVYTLKPATVTLQQNDYNSQQLSSFASWRPVGSPMTVTSSVRLLKSKLSTSGTAPLRLDDTNFNLGVNYAWSSLLRTYASVNVNDNGGIQTLSTNASLAAQKAFGENPDALNVGGFRYARFAGASLSNQTTTTSAPSTAGAPSQTATTSVQSLGGNLGHDLSRTSSLGNGRFTIDLNQRLSEVLSTRSTPVTHLNSNGSLSWRGSEGRQSTLLSLRASDSRLLSGNQNFFQLINLQASRNVDLLRHQSLNGNLTVQTSRSGYAGASTPFVTTPSASLGYQNERLFAIRNLSFRSTLNITGADIVSSQNSTNPLNISTGNTARTSWDNDLNYFIGKLRLRLYSHIAEVNQVMQSSLLFTMNRAF